MYDNRQHELTLNTRIALFLGALALKMELVKLMLLFVFSFRVISYHAPFGAQRLSLYTPRAEGPSSLLMDLLSGPLDCQCVPKLFQNFRTTS